MVARREDNYILVVKGCQYFSVSYDSRKLCHKTLFRRNFFTFSDTQCVTLLTDTLTDQTGFLIKDFLFYGKALNYLISIS